MIEPTVNHTEHAADDTTSVAGEPVDPTPEAVSARARTQRRLSQARSTVSDATSRARRSATLPSRGKTETAGSGEPSPVSTLVDRVQAYRTYILGAAAALVALIAVARKRSDAPQLQDSVDLGEWHLRADPPEEA